MGNGEAMDTRKISSHIIVQLSSTSPAEENKVLKVHQNVRETSLGQGVTRNKTTLQR